MARPSVLSALVPSYRATPSCWHLLTGIASYFTFCRSSPTMSKKRYTTTERKLLTKLSEEHPRASWKEIKDLFNLEVTPDRRRSEDGVSYFMKRVTRANGTPKHPKRGVSKSSRPRATQVPQPPTLTAPEPPTLTDPQTSTLTGPHSPTLTALEPPTLTAPGPPSLTDHERPVIQSWLRNAMDAYFWLGQCHSHASLCWKSPASHDGYNLR